jgi:hypothetical protein
MVIMATIAQANTYRRPYPFDQNGCVRHLKAIARAVKDADGEINKIVSLFHNNSVFLPNNGPASRGIEEIEKIYRNSLTRKNRNFRMLG